MAEVILFRPMETYSKALSIFHPPLGLMYLAAALNKKGYSVKILDTTTNTNWIDELKNTVGEDTLFVGVGVMTGYQIKSALEFAKIMKEIKSVPIVWGGIHPTVLPEQTARHELVDIVVIGEGEETITEIADRLRNGSSLDSIPGIVYKKDNEIIKTAPKNHFLKMDDLAFPDYDMIDIDYYLNAERVIAGPGAQCIDINTDRGCPHRCGFCYNLSFNKRQWRAVSAGKLLEIIEMLVKRYDFNTVNFTSDNFFVDKNRVRDLCLGLIDKKLNIEWVADIRIDTLAGYDDDLLLLMKQSGCRELSFGVESGSDNTLEKIQKDISVEDILKAHEKIVRLGFGAFYLFMIGFPEETRSEAVETLKLMYHMSKNPKFRLNGPSGYVPFPGTPLFHRSAEMGFKPPEDLEGWINVQWYTFKFPWFDRKYQRFLRLAGTVAMAATRSVPNPTIRIIRRYFRLRLWGIIHGIVIGYFDVIVGLAIYRLLKRLGLLKAPA